MRNIFLAAIFTAAPAAARTTARVPVSGPAAIPGLGASFSGARLGPTPQLMPTLPPGTQMRPLLALALIPTVTPTPVQPAPALAASAKPIEGSPLGVLRDDAADETQKTAALNRFFENSAPSNPEALAASVQSAATSEGYTWEERPVKNGTIFSGEALPTVSVVSTQEGIEAAIDGKPVLIEFAGAPDGPPTAMIFKREGEEITIDLDSDSPAIAGTLSGENITATFKDSKLIISQGEGRFQMTLAAAPSLTSLQAGDVPRPVRGFAAYMLILRSIFGS